MSFAAPWMLLGLAAAAMPIWLHLRRRKEAAVPFPAMELLLRVANKRRRRIRVRRLFLLILRVAFIACVVLAMSRPGISVKRLGGIRSGAALAMVLVIDDTLSMQLKSVEETAFEAAKRRAAQELGRLRPGDAAAVVLSGYPHRRPVPAPEFDLEMVRYAIEELAPTYRRGDVDGALSAARDILEDSPLPQREVVFLTDLADASERGKWPPWGSDEGIGLRIIDVARDMPRDNAAVVGVTIAAAPDSRNKEVVVEVDVADFSKRERKGLEVALEVDGVILAKGTVDVPAAGRAVKKFSHRFAKDGLQLGVARIGHDALAADDERHFSLLVDNAVRVLVVDGDYRPGSYRDEAFYLMKALETAPAGDVPIEPVLVDVDAAEANPLTGHDVVFLAGVESLPAKLAERICDFVSLGGGLFVSAAGSGAALERLETVLPGRVRSIREAAGKTRSFRIAAYNRVHPVFEPFGDGATGLEQTAIAKHWLLEPEPQVERETLIELLGGLPLLLERRVENGRSMLLTTTIDRDWTDLPIRPGYLPLVQRATRYLAGRLRERGPRLVEVGNPARIEVTEGMKKLLVVAPDGTERVFSAKSLADRRSIEFTETLLPGHYDVWAEIPGFGGLRQLQALGFSVAASPAESDLRPRIPASSGKVERDLAPVEGRLPIAPYLLVAAMLVLLVETWLSGQGMRRSHLGARNAN